MIYEEVRGRPAYITAAVHGIGPAGVDRQAAALPEALRSIAG
jgi:hypothetical protein